MHYLEIFDTIDPDYVVSKIKTGVCVCNEQYDNQLIIHFWYIAEGIRGG